MDPGGRGGGCNRKLSLKGRGEIIQNNNPAPKWLTPLPSLCSAVINISPLVR